MPKENEVVPGSPAGAEAGLMELIGDLEDQLARERAKNQVLMERVLELEDAQADTDVESFSDVIPNESRDFWRGQLLENRCGAVKELTGMRERARKPLANAEPAAVAPDAAPAAAAAPAPAKVAPRPLHNRAAAQPPAPSAFGAPASAVPRDAATAAKLRNRAHAINQETGIGYQAAFRRAEQEAGV